MAAGEITFLDRNEPIPENIGFERSFAPSFAAIAMNSENPPRLDAAIEFVVTEAGLTAIKKFAGRLAILDQVMQAFLVMLDELILLGRIVVVPVPFQKTPDDQVSLVMVNALSTKNFACMSSGWGEKGHMLTFALEVRVPQA